LAHAWSELGDDLKEHRSVGGVCPGDGHSCEICAMEVDGGLWDVGCGMCLVLEVCGVVWEKLEERGR
jgi:hypothetical protein